MAPHNIPSDSKNLGSFRQESSETQTERQMDGGYSVDNEMSVNFLWKSITVVRKWQHSNIPSAVYYIIIEHEVREIMYLVASVCLSECPSVRPLTAEPFDQRP